LPKEDADVPREHTAGEECGAGGENALPGWWGHISPYMTAAVTNSSLLVS